MSNQFTYNTVSQQVILWYRGHKRSMPWRGEKDPYLIWLSEIILQQTRVEQGRPYYERFVNRFPSIYTLAKASQEDVMKAWEGLGYYSRARNLHKAAKIVSEELNGIFPSSFEGLKKLPGIGDYTAAAIASICYEEHVVVVDGNVIRFISRFFKIDLPVSTSACKKLIRQFAQWLMDAVERPSEFNQALMEFGALQCTPRKPKCSVCPLSENCMALRNGLVDKLPLKKKAKASRDRYFIYDVPIENGHTYIKKRTSQDIWEGLYEFALLERTSGLEYDFQSSGRVLADEKVKHVLSHQNIHARFIVYEGSPRFSVDDMERVPIKDLDKFAFSRLSTRFMEKTSFLWESEEE
ncbi:MAG: A/G-specific adenine glycosylase [Flavobacteriales bacterium]|nr:A/G-specific adenine glycosylase [Flavobacteriales bacterium]